jgi:hypothetical protein
MRITKQLAIRLCIGLALSVVTLVARGADGPVGGGKRDSISLTTHTSVLFRLDESVIDSTFMENRESLAHLKAIFTDEQVVSKIDSIVITGAASPEGSPRRNYSLAGRRAIAIYTYITDNYPSFDETRMRLAIVNGYWDGLIREVEADPNVPARDALLEMLRNPNLNDYEKSRRLNVMNDGKTFAYLRDYDLLGRLRRVTSTLDITMVPEPEPESETVAIVEPQPEPEPEPEPTPELEHKPEHTPEPVYVVVEKPEGSSPHPVALRTNLLLDIVGGPNVGIEVPIGDHFSVAGDFAFAYTRIKNLYTLQTLQGTLEGRYWFKAKSNVLTGWNIGIYGTYSNRFDIQWGGGYQGDGYWSAGLSGGYAWRLSDRLNLDVSALVGAVWLPEVRSYSRPQDGHLMWRQTHYNATRFLPTMLRANLVWLIGTKKKVSQ